MHSADTPWKDNPPTNQRMSRTEGLAKKWRGQRCADNTSVDAWVFAVPTNMLGKGRIAPAPLALLSRGMELFAASIG